MIAVENVSKIFGSQKAVDSVSFTVQTGEVVGFLGPNGAGKSTTMRMITGFLPPSSGRVTLDGIDVALSPIPCKHKIGYLPESAAVYLDMEVSDFLVFLGGMRGLAGPQLTSAIKRVVVQCQLQKVLGRTIQTLSKGYRQRVGLAQALLHDPAVLVLDEPTVGLDPNQILEIRELIREIGKTKTVLLSSHILQEVTATCSRVIIINDGHIVAQGTPDELTSSENSVYRVTVQGAAEVVKMGLVKLPGFVAISSLEELGQSVTARVVLSGIEDKSAAIFGLAVAKGWVLTELGRERRSLEDVFQKLTGGEINSQRQ